MDSRKRQQLAVDEADSRPQSFALCCKATLEETEEIAPYGTIYPPVDNSGRRFGFETNIPADTPSDRLVRLQADPSFAAYRMDAIITMLRCMKNINFDYITLKFGYGRTTTHDSHQVFREYYVMVTSNSRTQAFVYLCGAIKGTLYGNSEVGFKHLVCCLVPVQYSALGVINNGWDAILELKAPKPIGLLSGLDVLDIDVSGGYGGTSYSHGGKGDSHGGKGYGHEGKGYGHEGKGYGHEGKGYGHEGKGDGHGGKGYGHEGKGDGHGGKGYGHEGKGDGHGGKGYGHEGKGDGHGGKGYGHEGKGYGKGDGHGGKGDGHGGKGYGDGGKGDN